jgi:hypothetical protein
VPKENKKFINPLLRPSQDVAPTQETPVPEAVRSLPAAKKALVPSTDAAIDNPARIEETTKVADLTDSQTSTYPSMPTDISRRGELAREARSLAQRQVVSTETSTYTPRPEIPTSEGATGPQQVQTPSETYTYVPARTYTSPETRSVAPIQPSTSPVSLEGSAFPADSAENAYYTEPPVVRRRRGSQAFEKTHERITLWIDKRLKQAFEELAYQQELSKTSLLNEAVADLLRKYESR